MNNSGNITGQCRSSDLLNTSNTIHRYACVLLNGSKYCGHFYALYFEKDHTKHFWFFNGGHRHNWEHVAVWTIDGVITHGSVSAHGKMHTRAFSDLPFDENGHIKVVYHKECCSTHALRFAAKEEQAENPYGKFVTPTLISWHNLKGRWY